MDDLGFLDGKSVLITGASGFIGSHLAKKVREMGGYVHATWHVTHVKNENADEVCKCDLRNLDEVKLVVEKTKPDYVFHLASQAIVSDGENSPRFTLETNIMGTINLLGELASHIEEYPLLAVVCASTDKVYGRHKSLPYHEGFSLLGTEQVYETSKNCEDILCQMAHTAWDVPIGITRFGNVYGPGDMNFTRIIPGTIQSLCDDKIPVIRSNGQHYRDFVYIDDVVDGYIKLAEYIAQTPLQVPAIFNFGTGIPARVLDVVAMISDDFPNAKTANILYGADKEIHRQYVSSIKAEKELGWVAKTKLKQGIDLTVDWYKDYFNANKS
jgi:CDP-glucose 4,6-dehydratase